MDNFYSEDLRKRKKIFIHHLMIGTSNGFVWVPTDGVEARAK